MSDGEIHVPMARVEGAQLLQLLDDFHDLVTHRDATDPAVGRLTPEAYPGDDEASRAFREATHHDLLDRRLSDVTVVRTRLEALRADVSSLTHGEALTEHDVAIRADEVDAWIRTLAAVRLVIASRLGIDDEDSAPTDDPRYGVYEWLGYRLEVILQAADALLD